jgi:hypothetical protein
MTNVNNNDIALACRFKHDYLGGDPTTPVWSLTVSIRTRPVSGTGTYSTSTVLHSRSYTGYTQSQSGIVESSLNINYADTVAATGVTVGGDVEVTFVVSYINGATDSGSLTSLTASQKVEGGGQAGEATTLNGKQGSHYLNYANFTGLPTWNQNTTGNAATSTSSLYATNAGNSNLFAGSGKAEFMKLSTEIPSAVNLNNYSLTGFYLQPSNSSAIAGTNYPTGLAGILTVQRGNGGYISQRYVVYNSGEVWNRFFYSSSWSPWRRTLNNANFTDYAPTLTGSGASGTWGINISGNAATATTATSATSASTANNALALSGLDVNQFGKASYGDFTNPDNYKDTAGYRFNPHVNNPTNDY